MPTFILGAGFNADAANEAGGQQHEYGYPLVGDTLRLCFDVPEVPAGKSVEDMFAEALEGHNYDPIRKLANLLRHADHYVAHALALAQTVNCYQQFFTTFPDSTFLTFNYDSLPETFLFRLGRWYPGGGYGVPVKAHLPPGWEEFGGRTSSARVLHLHGGLCIRTSEYEARRKPGETIAYLSEREKPLYAFDASTISGNFSPFHRDVGADDVEDRIIAPVPDKTQGLQQAFIRDTYAKAVDVVRESDVVVAIGYSFNSHDRGSHKTLLSTINGKLLIVSPEADAVVRTIHRDFPHVSVQAEKATFKQWVAGSFPGLR